MPSAPCPTAGSITSNGSTCEMRPASPSRLSPASASTIASNSPSSSLRTRVSTLPRMLSIAQIRPRVSQLRLPTQAAGADAGRRGQAIRATSLFRATSTSAGLSRGGTAASVSPATTSVGKSLRLWTATSTSPASTAR